MLFEFRRPRPPWWFVPASIVPSLIIFGWVVFFIPPPGIWICGIALAIVAFVFVFLYAFRTTRICEVGILNPTGFVPWRDVLSYGYARPDTVVLMLVSRTANTYETVGGFYCPEKYWPEVEKTIQRLAPRARRDRDSV
jgi:hypothetical protein